MKFLVDEQLPPLLASWLQTKGFDAIHVTALFTGFRVPDGLICGRSVVEKRIVITRDADFLNTFLVKQESYKLVYVTTGNLKTVNCSIYSALILNA